MGSISGSTSASDESELRPGPFSTGPEAAGGEAALDVDPLIGQLLGGRYRVIDRLAQGGMGMIYRAEHIALRKEIAIKLVQDCANSDHAMRFLREAMLTSRIDHPNVISAIDYGTFEDGTAYLVMNLVEGPTLARVMEIERPMSWVRAAEIAAQIADAVAAAQAEGIVHRDLKPENVVLQPMPDGSDVVKVLDFGIAKYARDSLVPPSFRGAQHVTRMGVVVGTPGYMAPEQAVGMRADHRADLYSIGVMLWECVVGCRLWSCDDIQQLLTAQLGTRPPLVRQETGDTTIPEAFEALVAELLATRPEKRPQSAVEARDRLRALIEIDRRDWSPRTDPRLAQPRLIVVTPPPPTSTVFIDAALARWRAAAGDAVRAAEEASEQNAAQLLTARMHAAADAGEAARQPTTQVGFRALRSEHDDVALTDATSSASREDGVLDVAGAAERVPEADAFDYAAAAARARLRLYVAVPLALASLSALLWLSPAPDSSKARPSSAVRAHAAVAAQPAADKTSRTTAPGAATAQLVNTAANARPALPAVATVPRLATNAPPRAGTGREHANALRTQARAYFRRAEFELSAQAYRTAIKAAPGYAGAYAGLGASQLALGDARGAIASYERAIRRSPSTSGFHAALGRAYLMAGDRSRAVAEYRKAVALDPTNDVAFTVLAKLGP